MTASVVHHFRETCVEAGGHVAASAMLYLSPAGRSEESGCVRCSLFLRKMISLVNPGVAEAVIDADGGRNKVLDPATGDGRKLQFEHPCHRHVLHQDFLRL